MINEDYVSLEVAKLLKEKGFDVETEYCYLGDYHNLRTASLYPKSTVTFAPTHQMALKWLRAKGIFVEIHHYNSISIPFAWYVFAYNTLPPQNASTYEEAVDNAIKYILENWDDINKTLVLYYKNDSKYPKI